MRPDKAPDPAAAEDVQGGALNLVFSGNFLYPQGMAGTKRVQYFVDSIVRQPAGHARVLLFRQGHAGRDDNHLSGTHDGVHYETVGHDIRLNLSLLVRLPAYFFRGCRWLRRWRRPQETNVLFVYGQPNIENSLFVFYARMLGYRVVFDIVEDAYKVGSGAPFLSRLKAWSAQQASRRIHWMADAVIVISRHLEKKFERISQNRFGVHLIPISVDLSRVSATASEFHSPVRMLYAGSFAEKDDVESLIDAFACAAQKFSDTHLYLAGKGMESRIGKINAKIASSGCAERISYLGYLPDNEYYALLNDADILFVVRDTSAYADRGFPFKLGEYLATGKPVVVSAVGDVPEFISDGQSGYLVKPGSVSDLAEKIEFVLVNREHAARAGAGGRQVAEKYFDAGRNGDQFVRIIRGLA